MVVFAPDELGLTDKSPCAGIRADLKMCLLTTDCCRKVSFGFGMFMLIGFLWFAQFVAFNKTMINQCKRLYYYKEIKYHNLEDLSTY